MRMPVPTAPGTRARASGLRVSATEASSAVRKARWRSVRPMSPVGSRCH